MTCGNYDFVFRKSLKDESDIKTWADHFKLCFLRFPIFAVKLVCLLHTGKNALVIKWPSLTSKNVKILC